MGSSLLEGQGVAKSFGGLAALAGVDFSVSEGEIVGLIGPNGAGKTTLINAITGVGRPDHGTLRFDGHDLMRLGPERIARLGVARTFQIPQPFPTLSVIENVMVGAVFGRHGRPMREAEAEARRVLEVVGLGGKEGTEPQSLTIVELRRLELARALGSGARLLLLDEIHAGLTPRELEDAMTMVRRLRDRGITILMVEHLMRIIMRLCERIIVLDFGTKIAEGPPVEIARNPDVIRAYLGGHAPGPGGGDARG